MSAFGHCETSVTLPYTASSRITAMILSSASPPSARLNPPIGSAVPDHVLATGSLGENTGHLASGVGLRNESIIDRTEVGKPLWSVHLEKAAALVHFVFDRVGRDDFNVGRDHVRSFFPNGHAVPGM